MKLTNDQRGQMPPVDPPQEWESPDGRFGGWRIHLKQGRTLATPAVSNGRLFIGGGFGSYEFYAFDSSTGSLLWEYQTEDDGPTAAVVKDDYVAFNTESCELEVLNLDGKRLWKHWLGDPLMSMPAMDDSRVLLAYPDSRGDRRHYLGCFEREGGQQLWKTPISGEIISAPILVDGQVYLTTLDGSLYCLDGLTGRELWTDPAGATSSPAVFEGQLFFSQRREVENNESDPRPTRYEEHCSRRSKSAESKILCFESTATPAHYLDIRSRSSKSPRYRKTARSDASVGFSGSKGDSKMHQAAAHLGRDHVSSIWEFQGSRPSLADRFLYTAMGSSLHCVDIGSRKPRWRSEVFETGEAEDIVDHISTPAVIVNDKIFLGTLHGDVICFRRSDGQELWRVSLGEPIVFQPAVVAGRIYVPTGCGSLFSFETGDPADDGWSMWGGAANHNGPERS